VDREKRIQEEIEKTLRAFDDELLPGINPFLMTRIEAQLASPDRSAPAPGMLWRRYLRPVALAIIVLLNILTAAHVMTARKVIEEKADLVTSLRSVYETPTYDFMMDN
jgi:hypothetical protein